MASTRRVFFALWPDTPWCARLLEAAAPVLALAGGRALASVDLHVTLCFLGAVEEPLLAALCSRVDQVEAAAFELRFERLEHWREAQVLVATAPAVPAAALRLARSLAAAARELGFTPEEKPLRPHVTLARGVSSRARLEGPSGAGRWPGLQLRLDVSSFRLAESREFDAQASSTARRPRYRTLASWLLRRAT